MKKTVFYIIACLMIFASCSKGFDAYEGPVEPQSNKQAIQENVEKVFGVTFDPNHDWCSTISGELTIQANSSVKKVQLMVSVRDVSEDSSYDVTPNSMSVLNEVETNGQSSVKLKYDAPKDNLGLYVAFVTDKGYFVRKVSGNSVAFDGPASARTTRALSTGYTLPSGEIVIGKTVESFASQRNWIEGELLYELSDYTAQKMSSPDYSDEYKQLFRDFVLSYFPNGKSYNNLPKVKASSYYNDKVYPITTGDEPIIITPIYKCDCAEKYGNEVYNSDLYYYYFKEEDLNAAADPVAFLEALPKYKAIAFNECFGVKEDNTIGKHGSYALMYFGDGIPSIGTTGSYSFPKGYKIGFMVRAKSTTEGGKKQGELYGDGRLNNSINSYDKCNFKSSVSWSKGEMAVDGPRAAWLTFEDRLLLCWESGTDADFNDVILDVEGGIEGIIPIPDPDYEVYTFCFEDAELGDYDMNDVVIKAVRKNETTVEYSLIACGAHDELCVRNINSGVITDDAEVHALFGKAPGVFINTENGAEYIAPITVTKKVAKSFSFLDSASLPYIYDKTTKRTVHLSEKGEDPHGIMIPNNFLYPTEHTCIKNAYPQFNNWGENPITSTLWYSIANGVSGKVYTHE